MNNWINECKSSHTECLLANPTWVPSRLLDVGPGDGSQHPRLVETTSSHMREPYAALSHMWGDLIPLRALASNYGDLKSGIPVWKLSKNFANAVTVTRALGLRYVWIDSLCIIQDVGADW